MRCIQSSFLSLFRGLITFEQNFGRIHVILEEGELLFHELQFANQELLLHVEVFNKLGAVIGSINRRRFRLFLALCEVGACSLVPMERFVMIVLWEKGEEIGKAQYEPIIKDESLRCDFFVSLFLASSDVLYAIDGKSRNDVVEKFQMLVLLCYQLRKGLNHQVQVVDFVAEPLL